MCFPAGENICLPLLRPIRRLFLPFAARKFCNCFGRKGPSLVFFPPLKASPVPRETKAQFRNTLPCGLVVKRFPKVKKGFIRPPANRAESAFLSGIEKKLIEGLWRQPGQIIDTLDSRHAWPESSGPKCTKRKEVTTFPNFFFFKCSRSGVVKWAWVDKNWRPTDAFGKQSKRELCFFLFFSTAAEGFPLFFFPRHLE